MIDPDAYARVKGLVNPSDFTKPALAAIYRAAGEMHERGETIDYVTLQETMEWEGTLGAWCKTSNAIGSLLCDLCNCAPTSLHATDYARLIARHRAESRPAMTAGTDRTRRPPLDAVLVLDDA